MPEAMTNQNATFVTEESLTGATTSMDTAIMTLPLLEVVSIFNMFFDIPRQTGLLALEK